MNHYLVAAAAAALSTAALFSAPAFAGDMKLSWADLNLSTPEGQKTLDRRIDHIANAMCADQIVTGSRLGPLKCQSDLKASLAAQVAATNTKLALRN